MTVTVGEIYVCGGCRGCCTVQVVSARPASDHLFQWYVTVLHGSHRKTGACAVRASELRAATPTEILKVML